MYPVFTIVYTFGQLCKELLGLDTEEPLFKALNSGFDNRLFQVNRDIWKLGDRAKELGLGDIFVKTEDTKLLSKLEESEAGKQWLQEYRNWLDVEGWRNVDMWDVSSVTWIEDPSLPLRDIKQGIVKGGSFALDAARERLIQGRLKAEEEVLAKVPADKRDWFEKLMRVSQIGSVFSEEHNWYLDQHVAAFHEGSFSNTERDLQGKKLSMIPRTSFIYFPRR